MPSQVRILPNPQVMKVWRKNRTQGAKEFMIAGKMQLAFLVGDDGRNQTIETLLGERRKFRKPAEDSGGAVTELKPSEIDEIEIPENHHIIEENGTKWYRIYDGEGKWKQVVIHGEIPAYYSITKEGNNFATTIRKEYKSGPDKGKVFSKVTHKH